MVQVGLINRLSDGSYMIMASERLGTIMRGFVADVAAPGTLKWSGYYGANNADNAGTVLFGMIKDPDPTKCIMVGFSNSQNNFPDGDITDHKYSYNSYGDNSYDTNHLGLNLDGWAMKIDPSVIVADPNNGNALRPKLVWQKCYGSSYSDQFTGIVPSGSGYVVVGYTTNPNNTNSTYYGDIPAKIYQSGQAGAPQYRDIPDIWLAGLGPTSLTCTAGSTAPSLNGTSVTNSCPTTTVNLSSLYTGTPPSGTSLVWFNNSNHTGTAVSNPAAAPTGQTYYAFFYDNISDCYSPASQAVTANPSPCAAASVDCPKTQVSPAPVQGTPNQMFLIVTANVTTAGSFPVSVSGSGFSLYNGVTSVSTTTTGVQTFKIPVQYDGSALGTLTFSLGSNTCTANLSQNEVVNTNCNTWTLDKCTPQVVPPVLK
ncbi:hypothetical protein [Siphonobacter sp. SORGH_AS_1065]|uniref:hypothetical protein n=1 Tax=Siphonobacter sp. SORGH_AS_1065 TaxID=3041795 RepID=UPI0027D8AD30|nr:hypothetical protein [Siphonobacter sp. SORGH_AS_1065]